MDVDKLKKWLDVAQQFQGENFWSDIFESQKQGPYNPKQHPQSPNDHYMNQEKNQTSGQYDKGTYNAAPIHNPPNQAPAAPQPPIDIFESETEWIIVIDLPGVKKTDIQLNLVGRQVIIKGLVHLPYPDATIVHSERLSGTFERSINMPDNLSLNCQPAARFYDGILEVRLPREKPKKHTINID